MRCDKNITVPGYFLILCHYLDTFSHSSGGIQCGSLVMDLEVTSTLSHILNREFDEWRKGSGYDNNIVLLDVSELSKLTELVVLGGSGLVS